MIQLQNKATILAPGQGYDLRQNNPQAFSIIIHSTNGNKGSRYENEVAFLLNSRDVSAHFLIAKDGRITQFFDQIAKYRAWHSGTVIAPQYNNNNSIGVECHFTPGESVDLPDMQAALDTLVKQLQKQFTITDIETHRAIATPKGRKIDPSHISDTDFYIWKRRIMAGLKIRSSVNVPYARLLQVLTSRKVKSAESIAAAYTTYGELTGIGNVYPFAQWAHETGWGTSPRWLQANNPAGLGATNDGAWGGVFATISEGIAAQYAHLLAYSSFPGDNNKLIENLALASPRYAPMVQKFGRGNAVYWVDLNGRWAFPGLTYSNAIERIGATLL